MTGALKIALSRLRRFARREDGNGTLEFVLVVPFMFLVFASAMEAGLLSTRHVMLERGLDLAVRDVRIGQMANPDHEKLAARICEYALIIPNCAKNIRLEMMKADPRNWTNPSATIRCVDRSEVGTPVVNLTNGLNNQLMILRACVLFDPTMPGSGLGKALPKQSGGAYALVATSSYVMEPYQ